MIKNDRRNEQHIATVYQDTAAIKWLKKRGLWTRAIHESDEWPEILDQAIAEVALSFEYPIYRPVFFGE